MYFVLDLKIELIICILKFCLRKLTVCWICTWAGFNRMYVGNYIDETVSECALWGKLPGKSNFKQEQTPRNVLFRTITIIPVSWNVPRNKILIICHFKKI